MTAAGGKALGDGEAPRPMPTGGSRHARKRLTGGAKERAEHETWVEDSGCIET